MPVKSMTGFGRAAGQDGGTVWSWEIRTVNSRGFDLRLRMPQGFESLEAQIKEIAANRIKRGNCTIVLTVKGPALSSDVRLNETTLMHLVGLAERARALTGRNEAVSLEALLAMKGVIELSDTPSGENIPSALAKILAHSFETALEETCRARHAEGERLTAILLEKIVEIEVLTREAELSPDRSAEAISERLRVQIQRLLSAGGTFDENRLYQEAALIATKADIEEEIKRLYAHVGAAHDLMDEDTPVGRRLEFLAQEFQREANTLCSKSNAAEITRIGLRLKTAIDQFREQVQNVE